VSREEGGRKKEEGKRRKEEGEEGEEQVFYLTSEKDTQDWGRGRPRPRERLATGSPFGVGG
jgi:hypothetical protein